MELHIQMGVAGLDFVTFVLPSKKMQSEAASS